MRGLVLLMARASIREHCYPVINRGNTQAKVV
jgi:hypothetical protein